MIKAIAFVASAGLLTTAVIQTEVPAALKGHHTTLQAAGTLRAGITFQKLAGGSEKFAVVFSKTNMFRVDTPAKLTISNGKTLWTYNKAAKTYTEEKATLARTKEVDVMAWASFFLVDALKDFKDVTVKGNRALRGFQLTELTAKLGKDSYTLFLDPKVGIIRGVGTSEAIIFASDLAIEKDPSTDKDFTFVPPAGATKEEPKPVEEISYATVAPIFKNSCSGCHNSGNARGGYSVDDYASVMKRVTPGDANASVMVQYIKGVRKPQMPRGSTMPQSDIDAIEKWVNAGAKN